MLDKQRLEHLINSCNIVYRSTDQDIIVLDETGNVKKEYTQTSTPKFISDFIHFDYEKIIDHLSKTRPDCILYYSNTLELSYICIGLFSKTHFDGVVVLGPFIQKSPDLLWIDEIIRFNKLEESLKSPLKNYIRSLSVFDIEKVKSIGTLLMNMISHEIKHSKSIYNEDIQQFNKDEKIDKTIDEFNYIEKSFELESRMINALKKGDYEAAMDIKSDSHLMLNIENYINNDSLKSAKWLLFSANVLYSRAVIDAGVHPVTADSLSRNYSKLINKSSNIKNLMPLSNKMLSDYCNAVIIARSNNYSFIVSKAVTFIKFNLQEQISLKDIANYLHVNPSYLSTLFKKETGSSVTTYIQKERVDEAILLMKKHSSMTVIASKVGFSDPNYFTRIFKKTVGLSPTDYYKKQKKSSL